ncbi:MAG: enoyl-CoA hydratase/isomerase family protein [Candidatus Sulfotelmatobacter sp.]
MIVSPFFSLQSKENATVLRLQFADGTNQLSRACVLSLTAAIRELAHQGRPLIITGNAKFFSAGADLKEIAALTGPAALEFSKTGQALMQSVEQFPAPVYAAISGYCMGGGLDLVLACHQRIASPHALFGHRGAALGLITGWGGTQRLPRLVGKAVALEMFVAAEKISAQRALSIGLVDALVDDPVAEALRRIASRCGSVIP